MGEVAKELRYRQLVDDVRRSYERDTTHHDFTWCAACERHINLWAYWQGSLDADILLVGQDWGSPSSLAGRIAVDNILHGRPYWARAIFPTDKRLAILFGEALGIDIFRTDKRLFFTNLILGYRRQNNTGKFDKRYYWGRDLVFFKRLVDILQPKVVICLGGQTFAYALRAFGKKVAFPQGYVKALCAGQTVVQIEGRRFYGMAHCGNHGCLNRARYASQKTPSLEEGLRLQCADWQKIVL